ncbi:ZBED5 protein, partial [Amia calva]|nr:ZBED5 protein [Amia calva]
MVECMIGEKEGTVHKDFVFCRPLATCTTGEEIFNLMDIFMRTNGIDWARCVGLCSDGAKSMMGKHTGLIAHIRKVCPSILWLHCIVHRESLQGVSVTLFNTQDKVEAMIKKLHFWASCVNGNSLLCFPTLHEFMKANNVFLGEHVKSLIIEHLNQLAEELRKYSPPMDASQTWIHNPFEASLPVPQLSFREQEQLIDLSSDGELQMEFKTQTMPIYPDLAKLALKVLMPFATTYLCKAGFSALTTVKTKYRQKLDAEKDLRLKLSSIKPNIAEHCAEMQAHPSH